MKGQYTIMLPVANNLPLANDCINHLLSICDLPIIVVDDHGKDSDYPDNPRLSFIHLQPTSRLGLSKIWNRCIKECPTRRVIIASWRPRPTAQDILNIHALLEMGYGLVALQTLHFFAFDKAVLGLIGLFDEGFLSGQFEDTDFFNRLFMANIAVYIANDLTEVPYPTMWGDGTVNRQYYNTKWKEAGDTLIQFHEEVNIEDRKLFQGPEYQDKSFLEFRHSILRDENAKRYFAKHTKGEKKF